MTKLALIRRIAVDAAFAPRAGGDANNGAAAGDPPTVAKLAEIDVEATSSSGYAAQCFPMLSTSFGE